MARLETLPTMPSNPAGPGVAAPPPTEAPEFPGCKPVNLPGAARASHHSTVRVTE